MGLFNHKRPAAPTTSNPFTGYASDDDADTAITTNDNATATSDNTTQASYLDSLSADTLAPADVTEETNTNVESPTEKATVELTPAKETDNDASIDALLEGLVSEQSTPAVESKTTEPTKDIDAVNPVPVAIKENEPTEKAAVVEEETVEPKTEIKPARKPIVVKAQNEEKPANKRTSNSESRVAEFDALLSWIEKDTSTKTNDVQEIIRGLEDRISDIREALDKDTEGLSDEAKSLFEKNTDKNIELINEQISKERKTQTAFDNRKHQFISTITKALESYRRPVKSEEIESAVEHKDNDNNNIKK